MAILLNLVKLFAKSILKEKIDIGMHNSDFPSGLRIRVVAGWTASPVLVHTFLAAAGTPGRCGGSVAPQTRHPYLDPTLQPL